MPAVVTKSSTLKTWSSSAARRPARRGVEALEVVLALPILLVATIAVFEFGIVMLTQQTITTSAVEGVREAVKDAATLNGIAARVQEFVAVHNLTFSTTGTNAADDVRVVVEDGSGGAGIAGDRGNTTLNCSASGGALTATQARVTVCVRMTNGSNQPVPDWLSTFGFPLSGRTFEVSAIAEFE
jgi:Flp pilus assembly protein TadG